MSTLLELKHISSSYGSKQVLKDISFSLNRDEILGLVGESGSGKSTTARVITGLLVPTAGELLLDGKPLPGEKKRTKEMHHRIQMVFQNPEGSLNPKYKIGRILTDVMAFHKVYENDGLHFSSRKEEMDYFHDEAQKLISEMELPADTLERYPRGFSGGQKQRIALARALAAEPDILIADEPTSALDVSVQLKMLDLIRDIQKARKLSVLFISHDLGVIHHICDSIAVMKAGQLVEYSTAEAFFSDPQTAYGKELLDSVPRV